MGKYSDRYVYRVKKDNQLLNERCERYMKDLKIFKTFNDRLVQENLKLEEEILNLRKIVKAYENR